MTGSLEPSLKTRFGAEQTLVPTGIDNVVPHVRDRYQEMCQPVALWWSLSIYDPSAGPTTTRATGCHQQVGLLGEQVDEGKGIPAAASPPEIVLSHDGEAERYRRERMRHDNPTALVDDEMAAPCQFVEPLPNFVLARSQSGDEIGNSRSRSGSAKDLIHSETQILDIH
jgi:hypothetical protein